MSLDTWGQEIQRTAYRMWIDNDVFQEYSGGVQPFSSPLLDSPELLIIGYNPGAYTGSHNRPPMMKQFEDGDFSLPATHDYAAGGSDYPVANFFRDTVFREHEILTQSIETNRYYLRTSGGEGHDQLRSVAADELVNEYINFCQDTTAELINRTNPSAILAFGLRTLESLKADERYDVYKTLDTHSRDRNDDRLAVEGTLDGRQLIAINHPTNQLSTDERERIGRIVREALDL